MPKETFYNLNKEKQEKILKVLREEFESKAFYRVNVKTIVDKLNIARGSFYQYFEDLEDSYFTILKMETTDIHALFMKIFRDKDFDLRLSLDIYGDELAKILFDKKIYGLYKNRYLYWTQDLENRWQTLCGAEDIDFLKSCNHIGTNGFEKIHFIKAVIHDLIKRNFLEAWDQEKFLRNYKKNIIWINEGVKI
ncbi:TetR/AcrR family transcriptional regulator [Peptoniphilaceae bacterium SGI.131]